jgi:hypothetical protein
LDISWPKCNQSVPTNQSFGVVGVNGGLANNTNSCLKNQLLWASKSSGATAQDKAQLYVNTANPGGLNTTSWPKNNTDPAGNVSSNPYGDCDNSDSLACAWQYGWNRAVEDAVFRLGPATTSPASSYIWWMDVETSNTWKLSGTTFDQQSNTADMEGMSAYFQSVGGRVGIYSTGPQWSKIVGSSVSSQSNLNGLINWRPGGSSQSTAQQACNAKSLTEGGKVTMTQFISRNLDYDYSCI